MISRRTMLASVALPVATMARGHQEPPQARLPVSTVVATPDDAERLEGLYEALRATWPAEAEARHGLNAFLEDEDRERGWGPLHDARFRLEMVRNQAHGELADAVLEVSGCRNPTEDQWERFGLPLAVVATGRHLFVVHATDQAEYYDDRGGMTELVILEL